jgi:hypothetical protein
MENYRCNSKLEVTCISTDVSCFLFLQVVTGFTGMVNILCYVICRRMLSKINSTYQLQNYSALIRYIA